MGMLGTELVVAADEKLPERPCEGTTEVVRPCLAAGTERDTAFPELDVGPMFPPPGKATRGCALRRPLPSPLAFISSKTESSTETFFGVLTEVEDTRRDRLRSRVTSRSSDRFPKGVN